MHNAKPVATAINTNGKLSKEDTPKTIDEKRKMLRIPYQEVIDVIDDRLKPTCSVVSMQSQKYIIGKQ